MTLHEGSLLHKGSISNEDTFARRVTLSNYYKNKKKTYQPRVTVIVKVKDK